MPEAGGILFSSTVSSGAGYVEGMHVLGYWIEVVVRRDTRGEELLRRAVALARESNAKSWELRASTGLARLLRERGECEEAVSTLRPVYDWFTEGFDTADLKDAKALLDELN